MPTIEDHSYLKVCAELASCLSISLSAAKRKVEVAAARKGLKALAERKIIANDLLQEALEISDDRKKASASTLDSLLSVLEEDQNFMIED